MTSLSAIQNEVGVDNSFRMALINKEKVLLSSIFEQSSVLNTSEEEGVIHQNGDNDMYFVIRRKKGNRCTTALRNHSRIDL
jgi:hypothetical protein